MSLEELMNVCKCSDTESIKELLSDEQLRSQIDSIAGGKTCLTVACHESDDRTVILLLLRGASPGALDGDKKSPIYYAAHSRFKAGEKVHALLEFDPSQANVSDEGQRTILHDAAMYGYHEVAKALIERHCDVEARTSSGSTPLIVAAEFGRLSIVEDLLEAGAGAGACDEFGDTALHRAAFWGHLHVARLLIKKPSCDMHAVNTFGKSALDTAQSRGKNRLVDFLRKAANDPSIMFAQDEVRGYIGRAKSTKLSRSKRKELASIERKLEKLQVKIDEDFMHTREQMSSDHKSLKSEFNTLRNDAKEFATTVLDSGMDAKNIKGNARTLRDILRQQHTHLVECLNADDHMDYLFGKSALSLDELQQLTSTAGNVTKMRKMMTFLHQRGNPDWSLSFLESLERNESTNDLAKNIQQQWKGAQQRPSTCTIL